MESFALSMSGIYKFHGLISRLVLRFEKKEIRKCPVACEMVKISVNYGKIFPTYVGLFFISNGNYISTYFSSFQFFESLNVLYFLLY